MPWAYHACNARCQRDRVSILVLVEVLPWALDGPTAESVVYLFQSLFWWKYCPGCGYQGLWCRAVHVSILVLVEVLPWAEQKVELAGFVSDQVSILVLVEVLPWA